MSEIYDQIYQQFFNVVPLSKVNITGISTDHIYGKHVDLSQVLI